MGKLMEMSALLVFSWRRSAMRGSFIDTIVVCTLTALTILVSIDPSMDNLNGINLTSTVFQKNLGEFGKHGLGIIILLFSFSTMIGMANYNKKCWDYLFKGKFNLGDKTFIFFYSSSLIAGAVIKMGSVVDLIDIAYALMAIPNIIAVVYLAPKVKEKLKVYNKKYQV
jgi:AGCS family alanine or glycine:cation symporter